MAKRKIPLESLLNYIKDEQSYRDVREAIEADANVPNKDRVLQIVDGTAERLGINTQPADRSQTE